MGILQELFWVFMKIGAFTFGGGYPMIALLDSECVEKRAWISSEELSDVIVIAESTPGPIAINCATYTGYQQAGLVGAIVATVGMVLPSFLLLFCISQFFQQFLSIEIVERAFQGIRIAVAILIIQAGMTMVRKMLQKSPRKGLQGLFVWIFFLISIGAHACGVHISTIILIILSGILGYCVHAKPKGKA